MHSWPLFYLLTVAPAAWMDWRWRQAPLPVCVLWGLATPGLAVWTWYQVADVGPLLRLGLGWLVIGTLWYRGKMGGADVLLGLPLISLNPTAWFLAAVASVPWYWRPDRHAVPLVSLLWAAQLVLSVMAVAYPLLIRVLERSCLLC